MCASCLRCGGVGGGVGGEEEPARILVFSAPEKLRRAICQILSNQRTHVSVLFSLRTGYVLFLFHIQTLRLIEV